QGDAEEVELSGEEPFGGEEVVADDDGVAEVADRSPAICSNPGTPTIQASVIPWSSVLPTGIPGLTRVAYSSRTVPSPRIRTTATSHRRAPQSTSRPVVCRARTAKVSSRGSAPPSLVRRP